jgi:hypothetical protein
VKIEQVNPPERKGVVIQETIRALAAIVFVVCWLLVAYRCLCVVYEWWGVRAAIAALLFPVVIFIFPLIYAKKVKRFDGILRLWLVMAAGLILTVVL